MTAERQNGRTALQTTGFALLSIIAVLLAAGCWVAYQLSLMMYTRCGGTDSCNTTAQQGIYIGFVAASVLFVVLPIVLGVFRRTRGRSFWWLPIISIAGVLGSLALSLPLNAWAAS